MTLPVVTAVPGAAWEAQLVSALDAAPGDVSVVRRCVDLADLLAACAAGAASAVLLSADLRRLDREALARLATDGVAVVGLFTPGDDDGEQRLRQLGVADVLPADAAPDAITAALATAVARLGRAASRHAWSDPLAALPAEPTGVEQPEQRRDVDAGAFRAGQLVAVWGPTGAPGRTTVAVTLASELAALGRPTVLADADVYGGVVAQILGILDEAPGLASAARLANSGGLDLAALAKVAVVAAPELRVLTGISRAERWPELRPAALEEVWEQTRRLGDFVVVDCGFSLEQDEELAYDTAAPRRNGATLTTLEAADIVLAVGTADPVGVQRLVRGLAELADVLPQVTPLVVVNRVRRSVLAADPERQLREALERYAGRVVHTFVPEDRAALDAALLQGRTLNEAAPGSAARVAVSALAAQ
ncbi:MAG: chromosome partitioning protein, partial [Actinomycetota bacterium]|nr:chromosome partitioning protein [Actinomycetota bacterium]